MLGVDEALCAEVGPRVRAGGAQRDAVTGGEREQRAAELALAGHGVGEVVAAAGADLDLAGDQLAADRLGERALGGVAQLLEAADHVEAGRVEDGELLLEAHGAVAGRREDLDRRVEIEGHVK